MYKLVNTFIVVSIYVISREFKNLSFSKL